MNLSKITSGLRATTETERLRREITRLQDRNGVLSQLVHKNDQLIYG